VARYQSSTRKGISAFKDVLVRDGIPTTVRLNRGRDIQAACGQLAAIGHSRS
jgi:23S rRNA (adenine2503-C2)-methyltransferase